MKRFTKFTALLVCVLMFLSVQMNVMALEFGSEVTEGIPNLQNLTKNNCTALGTTSQTLNTSQMIAENDKYIFVAIGMHGLNFRVCSAIQIYDKATGMLLTTITQKSTNATWYCPLRDMHVENDVLYASWGNAVSAVSDGAVTTVIRAEGNVQAPVKAYDVSNVTENSTPASLQIDSGNAYAAAGHSPYVWGGISYLDEENGLLYTSKVTSKSESRRYYTIFETAGMPGAIAAGTTDNLTKKTFRTPALSMNAVQFVVKDNWLFEVLHENGGLVDVTATKTMDTNNQVRVYDLRNVEITGTGYSNAATDISGCLKGVYTTSTPGAAVIRDIEISGEYMYVATTAGIEVVSLAPAKAADASAETVLTATKAVTEANIGGTMDLDVIGGLLYAAYTGPEVYSTPNSSSSDGALVVYDIATNPADPSVYKTQTVDYGLAEISVNKDEGRIYMLNDVKANPKMTAYSYTGAMPEFVSITVGSSSVVTAGTHDIKVNISNGDFERGVLILALYEGGTLCDAIVKRGPANGEITMAEDYEVSENVTEIKAMFLSDLEFKLQPLTSAKKINK